MTCRMPSGPGFPARVGLVNGWEPAGSLSPQPPHTDWVWCFGVLTVWVSSATVPGHWLGSCDHLPSYSGTTVVSVCVGGSDLKHDRKGGRESWGTDLTVLWGAWEQWRQEGGGGEGGTTLCVHKKRSESILLHVLYIYVKICLVLSHEFCSPFGWVHFCGLLHRMENKRKMERKIACIAKNSMRNCPHLYQLRMALDIHYSQAV